MVGGHIDIDGEGEASAVPMDRLIKQQDEIGDKTPMDGRTVGPLRVLGEMMTSEWHLLRSCNVVTPAGHHVKSEDLAIRGVRTADASACGRRSAGIIGSAD